MDLLAHSYANNTFSGQHKPTVGVDFHFRRFEENGYRRFWCFAYVQESNSSSLSFAHLAHASTRVALQLWDIAGQDRTGAVYRVSCVLRLCVVCGAAYLASVAARWCLCACLSAPQVYYKDAFGALMVYDVSRPETFDSVKEHWKKEIDSKVRKRRDGERRGVGWVEQEKCETRAAMTQAERELAPEQKEVRQTTTTQQTCSTSYVTCRCNSPMAPHCQYCWLPTR